MIDHVSIEVRDLAAAGAFYDAVLATLDYRRMNEEAGTIGWGRRHPEFWVNERPRMAAVAADSGMHVCLRAPGKEAVQAFYDAAIATGGSDDGAPGPRPEYHESYYAAFVRDPDGNRVEVVTFLTGG